MTLCQQGAEKHILVDPQLQSIKMKSGVLLTGWYSIFII